MYLPILYSAGGFQRLSGFMQQLTPLECMAAASWPAKRLLLKRYLRIQQSFAPLGYIPLTKLTL